MKKLESTRKIAPGSVLRVYKKGFGYARLVVRDFEGSFFTAESDPVFIEHINDGDEVEAYLWLENDTSYDFILTVIGRITIGNTVLIFNHTEDILHNNENECLTARVSIPVRFFILDTGNENKGISTEKIVHHAGIITALSDREADISSMDDIHSGTLIKLHAFIGTQDLELIAKIDKASVINSQWNYHVIFTNLHAHERNQILDQVFTMYRE
ncbi:MAG TPA: hypothetical protein PK859_14220 [Spirochaetota bacterium]|nr:hypothetical protein [Spirochaetota bacterium]HPR50069.1 hypothetical protein [Spirochaetota bacterium]